MFPGQGRRFFVALVPLAYIAWKFFNDKLGANPIRELEIQTGLWTLRFLAITLSVTPARRLFGWNWLVKYRRMLGLFTFFYACVHLSMWSAVDWFFAWGDMWQEILKHRVHPHRDAHVADSPAPRDHVDQRLGATTRQTLGATASAVYVAAITGTVHYLWAVKKDTFFPLVYLAVFVLLLGFRVIFARQKPSPAPRTQSGATAPA